jgi:hypothetical protein
LVEPDQHAAGDGEVERQVGDAGQAREARERVRGALHGRFEEEVQRALERDEPVRVPVRFRCVPDDEAARELVEAGTAPEPRRLRFEASAARTAGSGAGRRSVRRSTAPRWWSCGVAEVVGCGPSREGCQLPAELVERALLGVELWRVPFGLLEFLELEREDLDPSNEVNELPPLTAWLERVDVGAGGHWSSSF